MRVLLREEGREAGPPRSSSATSPAPAGVPAAPAVGSVRWPRGQAVSDPPRSLESLWSVPAAAGVPWRGPRQRLNIDTVLIVTIGLTITIGLADADGLEAVTMRRVAQQLGVAPMTLYTYVPGKAEFLGLMLDATYTRMPRSDTFGRPWRVRLSAVAEENKALVEAHPWAATISTSRPPLGPG